MSFLLTSLARSSTKNLVLVRQAQSIAKLNAVCGHSTSTVQLNKYQNKFEAAKLDAKLIRSFSSEAPAASVHDHSKLWTLERLISAALVAVMPLAFITPSPILDYALALSLVTHVHWGIEAIAVDYVRPRIVGPVIPKLAIGLVYLLSITTLCGLYYFNYTDVGLSQAMTMFLKK